MKADSAAAIRASISFPPEMYETLETIAKEKKVSLAWVVREAAERYVSDETAAADGGRKKGDPPSRKVTRSATD